MPGEIFVCEKRPRWTPELQRQFARDDVRVRLFTRFGDLRREAEAARPVAVLIDFAAGPAECLQLLGRIFGRAGFPPVLVVGSPRTAELEWSLREFGVTEFLDEAAPGAQVARLIRRQQAVVAAGPARS